MVRAGDGELLLSLTSIQDSRVWRDNLCHEVRTIISMQISKVYQVTAEEAGPCLVGLFHGYIVVAMLYEGEGIRHLRQSS
jgi:hypothetical protein